MDVFLTSSLALLISSKSSAAIISILNPVYYFVSHYHIILKTSIYILKVFLDLKFHDIPNTASRAVSAAANYGADIINIQQFTHLL